MKPFRVLLKLSGESFCKEGTYGIAPKEIGELALTLKKNLELFPGLQLAIVVGGGNIIRGATLSEKGISRITADYMGMLGTLINAIALQDALEAIEVPTRVQTAITTSQVAEPYIRRRAIRHLEKGRVVILAGGTGIPMFTTDTVAVLRAKELNANVLLKATKVDGIYDKDPKLYSDAVKYDKLSYTDVLHQDLKVMDTAAIVIARDHNVPIAVFNIKTQDNLERILAGDSSIGTIVGSWEHHE